MLLLLLLLFAVRCKFLLLFHVYTFDLPAAPNCTYTHGSRAISNAFEFVIVIRVLTNLLYIIKHYCCSTDTREQLFCVFHEKKLICDAFCGLKKFGQLEIVEKKILIYRYVDRHLFAMMALCTIFLSNDIIAIHLFGRFVLDVSIGSRYRCIIQKCEIA